MTGDSSYMAWRLLCGVFWAIKFSHKFLRWFDSGRLTATVQM